MNYDIREKESQEKINKKQPMMQQRWQLFYHFNTDAVHTTTSEYEEKYF